MTGLTMTFVRDIRMSLFLFYFIGSVKKKKKNDVIYYCYLENAYQRSPSGAEM
jgi:hypothetical protein